MAVFEKTLFQTLFVLVLSLFLSYYFPTLVPLDQHMELSLSREIKEELLDENSMSTMAATQDGMMAVGSRLGEINIFSADGKLQKIVLTDVGIRELGCLSDGRTVILDLMNTITLWTKENQKLEVMFETLSLEEGGIGSLSIDSNDEIYVSYRKARKIQIFLPAGGKAARVIQCNGYEPMQITNYNDVLIIQQYGNTIIIIDKRGNIIHEVSYPNDQSLCFTVSKHNSILIASVAHEEGLLSIDERNNELKHIRTSVSNFKTEKPKRNWYYLQQFLSGEIAFSTLDMLYIFDLSKASTSGLLHRQVVLFVCQGIKYVNLPKKDSMNAMAATPDGRMVVGSRFGGINIFSTDGKLQQISLKDIGIRELGFLKDGQYVVLDITNTIRLFKTNFKLIDVRFKTLTVEEGGIGGLTVDRNDQIYVSYRKAQKIQIFSPAGGKAIREIPCDGYEPMQIISYGDVLIVKQHNNVIIIIDKKGTIKHELSEPSDHYLHAAVSWDKSVLIASFWHEEGLLSIEEYTTELKHMTTLISDFKIEKPERHWFYLQQFQSGEIAFCTPDKLYVFNLSKASTSGLLHRQGVTALDQGIKYVELPKKDGMNAIIATPLDRMAVGSGFGGITIFSPDGKLQQISFKDVRILELGFLKDGRYVVRDVMNTMTLYTPDYKQIDVRFETLTVEEGGIGGLTVDSTDQIYVSYRKAQKIQNFSPAGGKAILDIPCDGYEPMQISSYGDVLIIKQYSNVIIIIDKKGTIKHELSEASDHDLYAAVSNSNSVLIASVTHEEGLLSIDEYTTELKHMTTLISDFKIEKPERHWYYLQQFRSGEIAFSTPDRLHIFNQSKAFTTGRFHHQAVTALGQGIKYVKLPKKDDLTTMTATPDGRIAVGTYYGGIYIFSANGHLLKTVLKEVIISGVAFLSDGQYVLLDDMRTVSIYTPYYKKLDVMFETLSFEEGGCRSIFVDSTDQIYVAYRKAKKIQVFSPAGGNPIREIQCDEYTPWQITSYQHLLIVKQYRSTIIIIDKKGNIKHKLTKSCDNYLYFAMFHGNSVLIASVRHEDELLNIDEYTTELKHITTIISDFKIKKSESEGYNLQQFRSGEIAFSTPDRLYIFDLSKASTTDLLHRQVVTALGQGIKYVDLPEKDSMYTMVATPNDRMAVGSRLGGIDIFSADGKLQQIFLKDVIILELGFFKDGRIIVRDVINAMTLYTPDYKQIDVRFEALTVEEGGIGGLTVGSDDQIYVSYRKAEKIQVFSPEGGKAIKEIPCDGYEPWRITSYRDLLIVNKYSNVIIIIDKKATIKHELSEPSDHDIYAAVSKDNSVLIASVRHEEGLLSIEEYSSELKHMTTLISDFKIEKPERHWYYLQQFRSGEIAFSTPDRLYIFNLSKASTTGLLHRQAVTALGQGIIYVELPNKVRMNAMIVTPDDRMAVGSSLGGIYIFSADGKLQQISLKDIRIRELGFLKHDRYVVLDVMNTIRLYTPDLKQIDGRFETQTKEEGGIGGLTIDRNDQIYVSYRKAQKIQVFSPAGGKAIREIPCDGYEPAQITSYNDVLIVQSYSYETIIIEKMGYIMHKLTKSTDYILHADVSNSNSVLIASVQDEEGLLSIEEYTTELKHMTTLVSDFTIEKPERHWYYLQQFRSGEIAFSTPDRLYIFDLSKAHTSGLLNRQAVTALGQCIKYVELPQKDSMNAMLATPHDRMAVGSRFGGIDIFSPDGKLQQISFKDVEILELGYLKDGRYVVRDRMNMIRLYTPDYKQTDVRFETLTKEEGGIGGLTVDSNDQIYVGYRKAQKIQIFSPASGKTVREILCTGYKPMQITSYDDILIIQSYANQIIIIDKMGNIMHKLTKPTDYMLHADVSNSNSVLIASVRHEEGLLSIDEYTTELKHMTTLISDFKIEKLRNESGTTFNSSDQEK